MSTTNRTGSYSSSGSSGGGSRSTSSRSTAGGTRSGSGSASRSGSGSAGRSGSGSASRSGSGSAGRSGSGNASRSGSGSGSRAKTGYSSGTTYRSYRNRRRKPSPDYRIIAIIGVILILVIAAVAFAMTQNPGRSRVKEDETASEAQTSETAEPETELVKEVTVDDITITGMSREQAKEAILKNYPWRMTAVYEGDVYELTNLMSGKVDALLEEIFTGEPKESYTLDTSGLDDAVTAQVAAMKERWNKEPKNGSISAYDASNDSFTFAAGEYGVAVDEEKLTSDIQAAIKSKDFDAQIQVSAGSVEPEITQASAQSLYKTIGTYTTNTTANSKRNTNVKLAAQKLNGTIVQPGQELSFNDTVGERTEEKGYQSAAAYNNGEVVQEIGGGVCQVSTTLYNAVLRAGLQISMRRSHTFEPSYVTPGQDATVSWGGPDFRFVNTSKAAVGIRASYSNQTVTVSVYGIPVLEDGVTYSLESTKLEDIDPPAPTYQEDQSVQPGQEVTVSSGSMGSRWETRLIVKKNGEVISRDVDHTTSYKGHAPVIKRNTSGIYIPPADETTAAESSEAVTEPSVESVPSGPLGPMGPAGSLSPTDETTGSAVSPPVELPTETPAPDVVQGQGVPGPAEVSPGPGGAEQNGGDMVVAPPPIG